ncbi:MAG: hypothetical protein ACREBI_04275 [Nitrosotalea sp.]
MPLLVIVPVETKLIPDSIVSESPEFRVSVEGELHVFEPVQVAPDIA